ncbi:MAG: hypothetical protein H8D47_04970 [Planctomycetes bacterium]|nr:hypothetical protein [Planctomycetota bacterium]
MKYIYCHPLFDERKCSHRFSYQLSESFRQKNRILKRFDYKGTGEADGDFSKVTLNSIQKDLQRRISCSKVCLIGTRLGASIAFNACCHLNFFSQTLVLIEPVINGEEYINFLLRKQRLKDAITGNKTDFSEDNDFLNIEGYKTSTILLEQIGKLNLTEKIQNLTIKKNIRIVQISRSKKIKDKLAEFANAIQKKDINISIETFDLPLFWERLPSNNYSPLTKQITEWCCE